MGRTQFVPKGLTYKEAARDAQWVTIWEDPDSVLPPFEVELNFMDAKRHVQIFTPVGMAKGDDEKVAQALQKAQRTFVTELFKNWRGFTIKAHDEIMRSKFDLTADPNDPEGEAIFKQFHNEGMPYNLEWAIHIYANAPADRFSSLIVKAVEAKSNAAARVDKAGNGGSPTSAVA